ncbi:unnamed protein product, partial [marine sediment metagenome]
GAFTGLPYDVQIQMIRSMDGLQRAEIARPGYAIEYDFVDPLQTKPTLESKIVENLFLAGQVNGTSGYEEAAAQGIVAGINAGLKLRNKEPFVLKRSEAYIGVLVDDLVLKGTTEPYRMFTSRAEYRLMLRQDNADLRLMPYGYRVGLIGENQYLTLEEKRAHIFKGIENLKEIFINGQSAASLLARPEMTYEILHSTLGEKLPRLTSEEERQVELEIKYAGYIKRQKAEIEKFLRMENTRIFEAFDYRRITSLRREAMEKLQKV